MTLDILFVLLDIRSELVDTSYLSRDIQSEPVDISSVRTGIEFLQPDRPFPRPDTSKLLEDIS